MKGNLGASHFRWVLAAALLPVACGPERTTILWPELAAGEVQLFALIEQGVLRSKHGPFAEPPPEGLTVRALQEDGVELHRLVLRPEVLAGRVPAFDLADLSALDLAPRNPACAGVERREGARLIGLEGSFAAHSVLEGEAFVERSIESFPLALSLPVDEERCVGEARGRFVPFAATPSAIPDRLMPTNEVLHRRGTPLGPDRVVLGDALGLFVVDRGQAWGGDARRQWDAASHPTGVPSPGRWDVVAFAVDRARSSADRARIIALLRAGTGVPSVYVYEILELWWTPEGFAPPASRYRGEPNLLQVFDGADGRSFVLGDDGSFLVQTSTGTPFELVSNLGFGRANLTDMAAQSSATEPLVLLDSAHSLYFGTALEGEPFRPEVGSPVSGGARSLIILDSGPGQRRYFSDTESPELVVRQPSGAREVFAIPLPPSLARCGAPADACGERTLGGRRLSVVATDRGTLLVVPTLCAVVLEVHPDRGCTRVIEYDAEPWMEGFEATRASLWRYADGRIFLTGRGGVLLELQGGEP